jgi:transcriptional regulator with XRE-family HTH domain
MKALRALAARLRAVRTRLGLSQEAAAERVGIHAKHLQRLESGRSNPTVATLAALAHAYDASLETFFSERAEEAPTPFHALSPEEARPFENCVPLYPLEAAAGAFGSRPEAMGPVEPVAWVVPHGRRRPGKGLFVARVLGESMNRRIPNGAYCLFRTTVGGSLEGRVLLVQLRDVQDPDSAGRHTVKIWRQRPAGRGRRREITLCPDSVSPGHLPITLPASDDGAVSVVAELVEVLAPANELGRRR